MTTRELDRLQIIHAVVDASLKPGRAAERLALMRQQVRHLVTDVCGNQPANQGALKAVIAMYAS